MKDKIIILNSIRKNGEISDFMIERGKIAIEIEKAFLSKTSELTIYEKNWIASEAHCLGYN